jgi:hypothetical protein
VDFLVGFTIFMFSLIVVANMVPSLLVGLQRTIAIDYDAVAYRTAVILVEDPGHPMEEDDYRQNSIPWDNIGGPYTVDNIKGRIQNPETPIRFGLALSRETPNILSRRKINIFFNKSFITDDYRKVLIFGNIQYGFNITLTQLDPMSFSPVRVDSVGSPYPAGRYGYIRRYVKIKNYSNVTIHNSTHPQFNSTTEYDDSSDSQVFTVRLDGTQLYKKSESGVDKYIYSPPYVIDPTQDEIWINLTGLRGYLNNSYLNPDNPFAHNAVNWSLNDHLLQMGQDVPPTYATLKSITFRQVTGADPIGIPSGPYPKVEVYYHDDNDLDITRLTRLTTLKPANVRVGDSIRIKLRLWDLDDHSFMNNMGLLDIVLTFQEDQVTVPVSLTTMRIPHTLLNGTFMYDYANVTQPPLSPGILEVAIW